MLRHTYVICPVVFNPLNAELNPICHLLALLGAHHILHVSRVRVNHKPVFALVRGFECQTQVVRKVTVAL